MATEVVMPKLGMTMIEGTLSEWLVADGTTVAQGTPVFRLTTEKIDFEVEADAAGVLRHAAQIDDVIAVGATVAFILAPGEAPPAGLIAPAVSAASAPAATAGPSAGTPAAAASNGFVRATPAARKLARDRGVQLGQVRGTGPEGRVQEADVASFTPAAPAPIVGADSAAAVRATPLARRLAAENNIDLTTVQGSGPGGRIQQEDVERAMAAPPAPATATMGAAASGQAPSSTATATAPAAAVAYRGMRRTIGERMHASLQEMAQLTLMADADVTELVRLRGQLLAEWSAAGARVSYTDLVIKAAARALREHPRVNASLEGDSIVPHETVDVGMAVALDEGLIVPVVRSADQKPLRQIATETAALAERARSNKLGFDEISGGTFSVTSLGMYGIDGFTPIINPPQVAILGVGRIRDGVGWQGERAVKRQLLTLSLTIDHRVLDGAPAAAFLGRVRELLEKPYLLGFE